MLDRPVSARVLLSAAEVALRSRRRQYELRELIASEQMARQDAEKAARSKDEFLAVVSHELRTPLNAILGWTQVLKRKAGLADSLREGLDAIDRGARAQTRLIEDLLDMSRITGGKLHLDVQTVWIRQIVEVAIETIKPEADAKNIAIRCALDESAGPIQADSQRLQQVIWNILTNAVKFTPEGGRIDVSVHRGDHSAAIRIADTGMGIDPDFLPHIFDQFRQADSSAARRFGGLGLGLAIVKQLVQLHGGSVSAHSEGKGKGTTFVVQLQLMISAQPLHGARNGHGQSDHVDLSGLSVLVIEDDPDTANLLRIMLEHSRANVTLANSGCEALLILDRTVPDVLLSDIGMPGMDGFDLIREIRRKGIDKPAVAVTAFTRPEDQIKAMDAGFTTHLSKPVEPSALVQLINSLSRGGSERLA